MTSLAQSLPPVLPGKRTSIRKLIHCCRISINCCRTLEISVPRTLSDAMGFILDLISSNVDWRAFSGFSFSFICFPLSSTSVPDEFPNKAPVPSLRLCLPFEIISLVTLPETEVYFLAESIPIMLEFTRILPPSFRPLSFFSPPCSKKTK